MVIGTLVSAGATLVPLAFVVRSAGGPVGFWRSIWDGYSSASDVSAASFIRIDTVALIGRLVGESPGPILEMGIFFLVLTIAALVIHRVRQTITGERADLYCIAVASIALLISVYQLSYAALLLVLPFTALVLNRWVPVEFAVRPVVRVVLMILLLIPIVNYAASFKVIGRFEPGSVIWLSLTSINGFAVLLAFVIYVLIGISRTSETPLFVRPTQQRRGANGPVSPVPE